MNSRERTIRAIEFSSPDRTPQDLWWMPAVELFQKKELEDVLQKFPRDIQVANVEPGKSNKQKKSDIPPRFNYGGSLPRKGRYIDEWGCIRHVAEDGVTGEVKNPILENLNNLDKSTPPWEFLENTRFDQVKEVRENSDKFLLSGVCARPFERMQFIRGTENLFRDIVKRKRELIKLRDLVHEYNLRHIEKWLATKVDGLWIMDDWGAQNNLLISPDVWRDLFKPLYTEYCKLIHSHDKYVFFHSDGWIEDIFGDLIDVGFDVINSQLFTMNIEALGRKYKGEVTFWGEIDRQKILPFGDPFDVKRAVRRVRNDLEDETGGMIAQCSWGKSNPKENIEAVFDTWQEPLKK